MFKNTKLSSKINFLILFCIIISISILSLRVLSLSKNMLIETSGNTALDVAAVSSATIIPEKFDKFKNTMDVDGEYYQFMKEKLEFIRKISGSKYLYAMTKNANGEYIYLIDGSEDAVEPGTVEEEYDAYNKVYSGEPYIEKTVQNLDKHGVLISAYHPIEHNGKVLGFVGVDYDVEKGYEIFEKMQSNIIILSVALSILMLLIGFIFSKRISKPLEKLAQSTKKLSEYDLSVDSLKIKSSDEIGNLTQAFNVMVKGIKDLIQDTQGSTVTISKASGSLLNISDRVHDQIDQIASAIQNVAEDITSQAHDIADGSEKTNQLAESIEAVATSIENISNIFSKVESLNNEGTQWVTDLTKKSEEAYNALTDVSTIVKDVDEGSNQIGNILATVESIAEQTNLLALNASIEAARSGEHGRGFAVVAEEIRKLAEESSKSTEQINNYIVSIQSSSGKAVGSMESSKAITHEQNQIIHKTSDIFKQLSDNIHAMTEHIRRIEVLNQDMNIKKDSIIAMINGIQTSSEEVSAVSQQTSASSEEIVASVSDLNQFANDLADLSQKLQNQISKFKT